MIFYFKFFKMHLDCLLFVVLLFCNNNSSYNNKHNQNFNLTIIMDWSKIIF